MGLLDLASNALRGVTEKIQRNAIGYSIYGICGLAVLILSTSAGVMALTVSVFKQWTAAASPSNFLALNPEAQKDLARQQGREPAPGLA